MKKQTLLNIAKYSIVFYTIFYVINIFLNIKSDYTLINLFINIIEIITTLIIPIYFIFTRKTNYFSRIKIT